jgi:predicted transcriptional regulator
MNNQTAIDTCGPEPILTFVRRQLAASKGTWSDVSRQSGVPYHTLVKIAQGVVVNPRIQTLQGLADHFNSKSAVGSNPSPEAGSK